MMKKIFCFFIFFIFLFSSSFSKRVIKADEHTIDNLCEINTKTDYFYFNDKKYSIQEYKNSYENDTQKLLYGKNKIIYNNTKKHKIIDDDPIIQIIPKELFQKINKKLYLGREFGFFIETTPEYYVLQDNNKKVYTGNLKSLVIVFDFIRNHDLNENIGKATTRVEVLFQTEFVYTSGNNYYFEKNGETLFSYDFSNKIQSLTEGSKNFVFPAIINSEDKKVSKYYMSDVSFFANLFNINSLNYGDEKYTPIEDPGMYFTRLDYVYDGVEYSNNGINWKEIGIESFEFFTSLILGKVLPPLGLAFDITSYLASIIPEIENYKMGEIKEITNNKFITQSFFQEKRKQIEKYNALSKTALIKFNSNSNCGILYGSGNYAEVQYTINSGLNDEYTEFRENISLKIVDPNLKTTIISGNTNYSNTIGEKKLRYINIGKQIDFYSLKGHQINYLFEQNYCSDYCINILSEKEMKISFENKTYKGKKIKINKLYTNKENRNLVFFNLSEENINAKISIEPKEKLESYKNYSDKYITKIENINGAYKISSDENCFFELYNEDFLLIKKSNEVLFFIYESNKKYYLLISNNSNKDVININYDCKIEKIELNENINSINTKNENIFFFKPKTNGSYTIFINETIFPKSQLKVYNEGGFVLPINKETFDEYSLYTYNFSDKNNYYIVIKPNGNNEISIVIEFLSFSVDWFYNDNIILSDEIVLKQGIMFDMHVLINKKIKVTNLKLLDNNDYIRKIGNSKYMVDQNAPCDESPFGFVFLNQVYLKNIIIEPEIKVKISPIYDYNLENEIKWELLNEYCSVELRFEITIPNGKTKYYEETNKGRSGKFSLSKAYHIFQNIYDFNVIVSIEKVRYYQNIEGKEKSPITFFKNEKNHFCDDIKFNLFFGGGSGSESNPFIINNENHFKNIRKTIRTNNSLREIYIFGKPSISDHFLVCKDIYINETLEGFPILIGSFKGIVDSENKIKKITIKKLRYIYYDSSIEDNNYLMGGLFQAGYRFYQTLIENIHLKILEDGDQKCEFKGALFGKILKGKISNCIVEANFLNKDINCLGSYLGGIAGTASDAEIINSKSYVNIRTYGHAGGMFGCILWSSINNCEYKGLIELFYKEKSLSKKWANPCIGGIAGKTIKTEVSNCKIKRNSFEYYLIKYSEKNEIWDWYFQPKIGIISGLSDESKYFSIDFTGNHIKDDNLIENRRWSIFYARCYQKKYVKEEKVGCYYNLDLLYE